MNLAGNLVVCAGTSLCLRYSSVHHLTVFLLLTDHCLNNTHSAINSLATIPAHRVNLISQQIKHFLVKWARRPNYEDY